MPKPPADAVQRLEIRLPAALYEQIRTAASAELRSMNAEMVLRLTASFRKAAAKTRGPK